VLSHRLKLLISLVVLHFSLESAQMPAGLQAEHDILKSFPAWRFARTPEEKARWQSPRRMLAHADHPPRPVVRTNPVSGKQGMFVNEGFSTRIADLHPAKATPCCASSTPSSPTPNPPLTGVGKSAISPFRITASPRNKSLRTISQRSV
jgi:hypothetical protein